MGGFERARRSLGVHGPWFRPPCLGCSLWKSGIRSSLYALQVKFIKFFAWEDRWIQKALDTREEEMKWMIKGAVLTFPVLVPKDLI